MSNSKSYVIKKGGLFYEDNYCGYTARAEMAGFYNEDEALDHVADMPELEAIPVASCFWFYSVADLDAKIDKLVHIKGLLSGESTDVDEDAINKNLVTQVTDKISHVQRQLLIHSFVKGDEERWHIENTAKEIIALVNEYNQKET